MSTAPSIGPVGQAQIAAEATSAGWLDAAGGGYGVNALIAPLPGFTRPGKAFANTGESPLIFPALLDDFEFAEEASFIDYDTVSDGEHSQPGLGDPEARKQRRMTLSVLALDYSPVLGNSYPWLAFQGEQTFYYFRATMSDVLRTRDPVFFYATVYRQEHSELKMAVTVRTMRYTVRPGLPQARFLAFDLVEFRDGSVERATIKYSSSFPKSHPLADGDTYIELAQRYYGSPSLWRAIAHANPKFPSTVGTLNLVSGSVRPGTQIKIPPPPKPASATKR